MELGAAGALKFDILQDSNGENGVVRYGLNPLSSIVSSDESKSCILLLHIL